MIDLRKHCEQAREIVARWPEWKRGILYASMRSTNDTPRQPVINEGTTEERALRREVVELRAFIGTLLQTLRDIAAPLDCGCKPCTGDCRSQPALEIELEARMECAQDAIKKAEAYF